MQQYYYPKTLFKLSTVFLVMLALLIIHSCKKDSTYQDLAEGITSREVLEAKSWYESTYPTSGNTGKLVTLGAGKGFDYSQYTKPDWRHNTAYKRFNKNVIEMPIDAANPILSQLKNSTNNKAYADKENSRSSFLILNDDTGYHAYIMTVIGDPTYLKGNPDKLKNNTYNHRDTDFTGMVFYFTPKGQYVSGYAYKNGRRLSPASANAQTSTAMKTTGAKLQLMELSCVAWYMGHYVNGELVSYDYMYTICTGDDGENGGGGTPVPPAPLCPPDTTAINASSKLQVAEDDGPPADGLPPDDGGGFPPPSTQTPCTAPAVIDSLLKKTFPCASKLVIDSLKKIPGFASLISAFNGPTNPSLIYVSGPLPWNVSGANGSTTYQYGLTNSGTPSNASSTITLNTSMLQNSSILLIASVAIHETLHGVINSNIVAAGYNMGYGDSWMDGLNSWYLINGLPGNFRDHYEMMDYYFNQSVGILATWDNNQHSQKDYVMAMLTGLDNPGVNDGTDPNFAAKAQLLATEYTKLKSDNKISDTDIDNFKTANNYATTSAKLPRTGCN